MLALGGGSLSGVLLAPAVMAGIARLSPLAAMTSPYACVAEMQGGRMIWGRRAAVAHPYPASTVKLIVALEIVARKRSALDAGTVAFQQSDALDPSFTHIGLHPGERLTWRQMLNAILIASAGDAVQMAARALGNEAAGRASEDPAGYETFRELINQRLARLGTTSSTLANGHGAVAPGMVVAAKDLAILTAAAMAEPEIRAIAGLSAYTLDVGGRAVELTTYVPFLSDPALIAAKGGTWVKPGIVTSYNLCALWRGGDGHERVIVTMGAPSEAAMEADQRLLAARFGGEGA